MKRCDGRGGGGLVCLRGMEASTLYSDIQIPDSLPRAASVDANALPWSRPNCTKTLCGDVASTSGVEPNGNSNRTTTTVSVPPSQSIALMKAARPFLRLPTTSRGQGLQECTPTVTPGPIPGIGPVEVQLRGIALL